MATKIRNLLLRDGRYFARLVVPRELRQLVGKTELRTALGADRREAIRALPRALAGLQDQLTVARRRLALPAPDRAMSLGALAHLHYEEGLAFDDEIRNLSPLGSFGFPDENYVAALKRAVAGAATNDDLNRIVGRILTKFRQRGAMTADFGSPDWRETARTLAGVELEVLSRTVERDEGDYSGRPKFPILTTPAPHEALADQVSLTGLLQSYLAELVRDGRGHSVRNTWPGPVRDLVRFIGYDDARKLTRADLARWRDASLEKVAASSFQMVWLGAVRATLAYGAERGDLKENVAVGLKVRAGRKLVTREKGYTAEESRTILRAAHTRRAGAQEQEHVTAALRWLPWLLHFTGARVGELAQLRREDLKHDDAAGIWYLRLSPEAGTIKTRAYRDVPLHAQLIDLGFVAFVESCGDGPLFYVPGRAGVRSNIATVGRRLARFIQEYVKCDGVAPSHGFRHAFKSLGRELEIDGAVIDAIQGHKPATVGASYGHFSLRVKARAIAKFPAIGVE